MWEWRESTTRGGWRLDAYGTWTWDEPSPLDRAGAGTGALRGYRDAWADEREVPARTLMAVDGYRGVEVGVGAGVGGGVDTTSRAGARPGGVTEDPTPIFHALTRGRGTGRRAPDPRANDPWATAGAWSAEVPEPHPGSGPLPVQRPDAAGAGSRRLGVVPTVPAPPMPAEDAEVVAESPEEELMRRAERRRSPRTTESAGGRHALLPREEPVGGRHALRR